MVRRASQQEQRLAYLFELEDVLRPLADPLAIQEAAARFFCRRLGIDGAGYSVADGETPGQVRTQTGHGLGALLDGGLHDASSYGLAVAAAMRAGRTLAVPDVHESSLFSDDERAGYDAFGVRAFVAVPLVRDGRWVATFGVRHASPRQWTPHEVALVEDTAARTWTAVEQARAEEALRASQARARQSEDRYRLLHDSMRDAFVQVDLTGRIVDCNDAYLDLVGYTRDELHELTYLDLTPARWHEMEETIVREEILTRGYSHVYEKEYRRKDGSVVPIELRSILLTDAEHTRQGIWAIVRDITGRRRAEEALRDNEQRLRLHLENTPLAVIEWDHRFVVTRWAGEAQAMFGWSAAETVGKPILDLNLIYEEDIPSVERTMMRLSDGAHDRVISSNRNVTRDGRVIHCTWYNSVLFDADGRMSSVMSLVQDDTQRDAAEAALRESETALRFLTDEVRVLHEAAVLDSGLSEAGIAPVIVGQAAQLLGSEGTALFILGEGGSLSRVAGAGESDAPTLDDVVAQAVGERSTVSRPAEAADAGAGRAGVLLAVPLVIRNEVYGALAFTYQQERELDESRLRVARAFADQAALAVEHARLRDRLEEQTIEEERNRLARDLHDSVTQSLFAASLKAESLAEMPGATPELREGLEELHRLTRGAMAGMRTMLLEMRAGALSQTQLAGLLRHLVEAAQSRSGAGIKLEVHGEEALPPEVRIAAYRIAQEALNNVVRHAGASRVDVSLRLSPAGLRLLIEDDGRGFTESPRAGHFGLATMRERAAGVGAELTVTSAPGCGTVVALDWRPEDSRARP